MFPAGGMNPYGIVQMSAGDQLREASDRLKRLQATAAGPPELKDTIVVSDGHAGLLQPWLESCMVE